MHQPSQERPSFAQEPHIFRAFRVFSDPDFLIRVWTAITSIYTRMEVDNIIDAPSHNRNTTSRLAQMFSLLLLLRVLRNQRD